MNQIKKIKSLSQKEVIYKLERIKKTFHNIPIINGKDGYPYSAFTLTDFSPAMKPQLLEDMADLLVYYGNFEKADIIVSEADRGGGPLTHAVAVRTGLPYTLANWYPVESDGSIGIQASVGFSGKGMICLYGLDKNKKAILVDDIVSSGGTAIALIKAIYQSGGSVIEALFVGDKISIGGSKKIEAMFQIPVRALVKFEAGEKLTKVV